MKRSFLFKVTGAMLLMLVAFLTGASGSVLFAEGAVDLPDAGKTIPGAATITDGKEAVMSFTLRRLTNELRRSDLWLPRLTRLLVMRRL